MISPAELASTLQEREAQELLRIPRTADIEDIVKGAAGPEL
jgi:hypothetical protein